MYYYLDNERLQLWFPTPNVCAAFLVAAALLTLGLLLGSRWLRAPGVRRAAGIAAAGALTGLLALLAATYSRGGYLALAAGLGMLYLRTRSRIVIAAGGLAGLLIALTGNGAARVASIGATGDGSILHRLVLWLGGTGMIARYWPAGIPEPLEIGRIFDLEYKPEWLNEQYRTLISDYLTVAAEYGLPVLLVGLGVPVLLGVVSWTRRNLFNSTMLSIFTGYAVCAAFSTMYEHPEIAGPALALLAVWAAGLGWQRVRITRREVRTAAGIAGGICGALLLCGIAVNLRQPFRVEYREGRPVALRPARPNGGTVLLVVSGSDPAERCRQLAGPLARRGYAVTVAGGDSGRDGLRAAEAAVAAVDRPFLVVGYADGGRHALIAGGDGGQSATAGDCRGFGAGGLAV